MTNRSLFRLTVALFIVALTVALTACGPTAASPTSQLASTTNSPSVSTPELKVLAAESFIADMAQNVAGDRLKVETLMPLGLDPHAFEPTPQDVGTHRRQPGADRQWRAASRRGCKRLLDNAGGKRHDDRGISRLAEPPARARGESHDRGSTPGDPHFWLDPLSVIKYVENIRDGLSQPTRRARTSTRPTRRLHRPS